MKTKRIFNFIRWVAIAALVCTVTVSVVMMVYSATPGEKSAQQSNQVADNIKDVFDVEDEKVESARVELKAVQGFVGETYKLSTTFFPATTTDKEVTYASASPAIAEVSDAGELTFKKAGMAKITVKMKNNPSVSHSATMTCYGTHPNNITSVSMWKDGYKAGVTKAFSLKDQNGNELLLSMFTPCEYDKDALYFSTYNVMPLRAGDAKVSFTIKSGLGKKDYEPRTFEDACVIKVAENPDYIQPQDITLINDGVYDLKLGDEFYLPSAITHVEPSGASTGLVYYFKESAGILKSLENCTVSARKVGSIQVKISTPYKPSLVKYLTINVFSPPPTKLSVTGLKNARAQYDKSYTLRAFGDDNYVSDVTWSVVKGTGTIDPETGTLSDLKVGKNLTVRATYNGDESIFVDYKIKVVMYENFASSMRKLIGHFLLFVVIGFGLAYTYTFMIKPRILAAPLAFASGFALAGISELLQLPSVTTGRYATWSDVLIDFMGASVGIVFAFVVLGIILLIVRFTKSRGEFKTAFSAVSAKTMFRPATDKRVQGLLSEDEYKPSESGRGELSDNATPKEAEDADAVSQPALPDCSAAADVVDGADSAEDAGAAKTD